SIFILSYLCPHLTFPVTPISYLYCRLWTLSLMEHCPILPFTLPLLFLLLRTAPYCLSTHSDIFLLHYCLILVLRAASRSLVTIFYCSSVFHHSLVISTHRGYVTGRI